MTRTPLAPRSTRAVYQAAAHQGVLRAPDQMQRRAEVIARVAAAHRKRITTRGPVHPIARFS